MSDPITAPHFSSSPTSSLPPPLASYDNNTSEAHYAPPSGAPASTAHHNNADSPINEKHTESGAGAIGSTVPPTANATGTTPGSGGQNTTAKTQIVTKPKGVNDNVGDEINGTDPNGPRQRTAFRTTSREPTRQGTSTSSLRTNNPNTTTSGQHNLARTTSGFGKNAQGETFVKRMTTGLFTPEKKLAKNQPGVGKSLMAVVKSSYLTWMLVFIPISWALHFTIKNDTVIFIMCFLAIIPLAAILGFSTEELALRVGETIGGLLNATLGNAVELIVAIIALIKCELSIVQSSLIGSILSNLLLVLGMCFFAGGTRYAEQTMNSSGVQLNSSLLLLAVIAILIPSTFHFSITTSGTGDGLALTDAEEGTDILSMSHGVAIILLMLYFGYLLFQLFTHANLYEDREGPSTSTRYPENVANYPSNMAAKFHMKKNRTTDSDDSSDGTNTAIGDTRAAMARIHGTSSAIEKQPNTVVDDADGDLERGADVEEDEEQVPQMSLMMTIIIMVIDTVLVGVTAEFLVSSINGMVETNPALSTEWVGLILLPIVGNAAEHVTAVTVATKDKLDLAIGVAVGSSIQIALFVIPVCVLLAWAIGKPLLMLFDPLESVVLFLSVIVVNQTLSDGRSNWMEGMVLMLVYIMIAVVVWYYPGSTTANLIGQAGCS